MTRTPTLPPTDKSMWRRTLAMGHPDAGGSHEHFIWLKALQELVCNGEVRSESPRPTGSAPTEEPARVTYAPGTDFREATKRALHRAASQLDGYGWLLSLLEDCWPLDHLCREQERGASYKRLAAIGHMVGMDKAERVGWYRVAESIPLSDRHAGHILKRLKERAA